MIGFPATAKNMLMNLGHLYRVLGRTPPFLRGRSHHVYVNFSRPCSSLTDSDQSGVINTGELKTEYDAVVIGAGHNGLVAASYLQKSGLDVCVLEKRHVIGGAAVTEEIIPGFKFSRASYVLSLLRPQIIDELELKKHGLHVYLRNPNSYTPLISPKHGPRSLILSSSEQENREQIAQFSKRDAEAYPLYEEELYRMVEALEPLLDLTPLNVQTWSDGSLKDKWNNWHSFSAFLKSGKNLGKDTAAFYELLTAPASKVLDKWFESEPLKATLATDSVIGAMTSPKLPGSGYVLLHHVMGELEGIKGAWGYVQGGMGAVSMAMAKSAKSHGSSIFTEKPVQEMVTNGNGEVTGVVLTGGQEIKAKIVLSNATPKVTYFDLLPKSALPEDFTKEVSLIDYTSPVTKINVAVSKLPNFLADPNTKENTPGPQHMGTIHLNCEDSQIIHEAYLDALNGQSSQKPVIEMTIPSSVDPTISPAGAHVVQLFTQYTPYTLANGKSWDDQARNDYADKVFNDIEAYAPGFKSSVIGRDVLTPPDIEKIFGLTGGNIFHGAMSLDQLYFSRPVPAYWGQLSPVKGLYLCGSGAHPGGGVMGSPGRLAALMALQDFKQ